MAEATLNAIKSAQYQVDGVAVRLLCSITTPEGEIWDTDFVVVTAKPEGYPEATGLQGVVERWVAANPDQILPFSADDPPAHNPPVHENAPPPDPGPPPWVDPGPPHEAVAISQAPPLAPPEILEGPDKP